MAGRTAGEEGLADSNRWRDPGWAAGRMEAGSKAGTASQSVSRLLSGITSSLLCAIQAMSSQRIDRLQPTACAVCQDKTGKEAKQSSRSDKAAREGLTYLSAMMKTQDSSLLCFFFFIYSSSLILWDVSVSEAVVECVAFIKERRRVRG